MKPRFICATSEVAAPHRRRCRQGLPSAPGIFVGAAAAAVAAAAFSRPCASAVRNPCLHDECGLFRPIPYKSRFCGWRLYRCVEVEKPLPPRAGVAALLCPPLSFATRFTLPLSFPFPFPFPFPRLRARVSGPPGARLLVAWVISGGRGRGVSIFLDKNRCYIGKSQSKRAAKKDATAAAAPSSAPTSSVDAAVVLAPV
jgi:hypothetical protein